MQEMQETWLQSLSWEDPLEEEMATHCSVLAWRIPWAEQPGGLQSMGSQSAGQDCALTHTYGLLNGKEMNFCLGTFTPLLTFSSRTYTK